jgi:hypothetical protein
MGAGTDAKEHDDDKHAGMPGRPSRIHVQSAAEQRLQIPAAVEQAHSDERKLPLDKRPVYWRGRDWRDYDWKEQKFTARQGRRWCLQAQTLAAGPLTPIDQRPHDGCAGAAVASCLRANLAIHRGGDPGPLNWPFIWGLARERDAQLRDRRSGLLGEALWVVNNYDTPDADNPPSADEASATGVLKQVRGLAREFKLEPRQLGQGRKIQGVVNLGAWLGDWSAWLHAYGPIVANMMIEPEKFNRLKQEAKIEYQPGQVSDGALTNIYKAHAVTIVGYLGIEDQQYPDSFVVLNSYGDDWGDGGYAYLRVRTARQCLTSGYGLLLREHLAYAKGGIASTAGAARSFLFQG